MHHLSLCPRRGSSISRVVKGCQDLVRFFALLRIKPHAPPLVRAPVNSFEFQPCGRTPQAECLMRLLQHWKGGNPPTLSTHRLRRDYQVSNPVCSHASEPQRQLQTRERLRHWCSSIYLRISPLHGIPLSSSALSLQFPRPPGWSRAFTSDLRNRLRSLYAQ